MTVASVRYSKTDIAVWYLANGVSSAFNVYADPLLWLPMGEEKKATRE